MEYLKIRNWDKWQTYRSDRGQPPWIKIHRCVMRDPEWVSLSDAEKGQLVSLWLLAADNKGSIPADEKLIQKLCFLTTPLKLNKFIELNFIYRNDADLTPEGRQDDQPKAETETETEAKAEAENKQSKFDKFYAVYPKKKNKGQAEKAFFKINPNGELLTKMVSVIEKIKKTESWLKNNGQFIPYPATWLNAKGWEDEIIEEPSDTDIFN
jgi:hypothetical protein